MTKWMDVDTALPEVEVNVVPLTDDADFKAREESVTYDQAGMDLTWNFTDTAGNTTKTTVVPTTGGLHNWTNKTDGDYTLAIPASGGTINNDTEGFGYFKGVATGILPWVGPTYGFRAAALNNALIDGGDNLDVNTVEISGDTTAADNLEAMYDGTGYVDDTAPASRDQVSQIANVGAAINVSAIPSPNGFTLTTGSEVNNEDATVPLDGTRHELSDAAGTLDAIYKFDIGGDAAPVSVTFTGVYNSNNDSFIIEGNTGSDGTPVWVQIGTLDGTNSSSDVVHTFTMFTNMIVTDITGQVQVRVSGTGLTSSSFDTDQVFVSKSSTSRSVGYEGSQIWVDTNNGTAGTEPFVNGVGDKPVLTWANALSLSSSVVLTDFHLINGSLIALSADSSNYSLFGDNWTLQLAGQVVTGLHAKGAIVSGICTAASEVHFEGCDIGTMSVQHGGFDFCRFAGTVTHTLAGDYNYRDCSSDVPGADAPVFTKTAGQTITSQFRRWSGGWTYNGLEAGDVVTIGGSDMGEITITGTGGLVEVRGIYKSISSGSFTGTLNLDGAIKASDVALILGDTNELQTDWVDGGRLDLVLDSRATVTGVWSDTLTTYTDGMAGKRLRGISAVPTAEGTINDAGATTTAFTTTLTGYEVDNFKDQLFTVEIAPEQWQSRPILSSDAAGGIVLDEALTSAPANGSVVAIHADHIHPVSQIQDGLSTLVVSDILSSGAALDTTAGVLNVVATVNAATLADGVTHGGTTAMLRLGSSTSTPAIYVTNSFLDAATVAIENTNVTAGTGLQLISRGNTRGTALLTNVGGSVSFPASVFSSVTTGGSHSVSGGITYGGDVTANSFTGNLTGDVSGSVGSVLGGIDTTLGTITTLDGLNNLSAQQVIEYNTAGSDGTAPKNSLYTMIHAGLHADSGVAGTLTIYETDDTTVHQTFTLTVDDTADPITKVAN